MGFELFDSTGLDDDIFIDRAIEEFDLIEFLDTYSIDYALEGKNIGVNHIGIETCPFCSAGGYHFGIERDTKIAHCFVCGKTTNIINTISKLLDTTYGNAKEIIISESSIDFEDVELLVSSIFSKSIKKSTIDKFVPKEVKMPSSIPVSQKLIKNNVYIREFLKQRKVDLQTCFELDFRVGLSGDTKNRLIMPVMHQGKLVGYQSRSFVDKRYKIEGNLKHFLYKADKIKKGSKILICEGIFDFVSLRKFVIKFYKNKYEVTTPFSKILSPEQIALLNELEPSEIIYFLDYDAWFDYSISNQKLICHTNFVILPYNKDPGAMREKEFLKVFVDNNL